MTFASARRGTLAAVTTAALLVAGGALAAPASAQPAAPADPSTATPTVRVATYNLSLNRAAAGQLEADLSTGTNVQARTVAEIIQRTNPDVVLLNEFDYVAGDVAADLFRENYLEVSQNGAAPVEYPYAFVAPSNTGIPSGFDLNNDGTVGGPDDALGFGFFEGQFGMAVLSKYPIATDDVRTFQNFLWKDMPGALLPDDLATPEPADWFTPEELEVVRLSSKSHWDVPVQVGKTTIHVLASHPTPPTFDAAEDRNGRRNHDEIRFWADYITPSESGYIVRRRRAAGRHRSRRPVRHPRRSERRPAGRRLVRRRHPPAAGPPADRGSAPDVGRCRRGGRPAGRSQPHARGRSRVRHRGLRRQCARQLARRLRAALEGETAGDGCRSVLARRRRPALGPHRNVPVPEQRSPARLGRPPRARREGLIRGGADDSVGRDDGGSWGQNIEVLHDEFIDGSASHGR